jgi:hypothetical protein
MTRTSTEMDAVPPTRVNSRSSRHPEELDLGRLRDLADLVEEDRSPVGQLESGRACAPPRR